MLMVLDVGNTHMVIGVFKNNALVSDWRIHTDPGITEDEFYVTITNLFSTRHLSGSDIQKVVISSVVPPMMRMLESFCRKYLSCTPVWIDSSNVDMPILYTNPSEVGADRLVNAIAAYHKHQTALIVIDFGTATTFDVITDNGEYLGGAISPGIGIAAEALFQRASKLPRVDLNNPAETAIGKNTAASMKSGIIFGYAELVDGMVRRIKQEMTPSSPKVIATGGLAPLMQNVSQSIEYVDQGLTLEGLRIISNKL
jgi:type III pantothenate kinase